MKVMVENIGGRPHAVEIELADLLTPEEPEDHYLGSEGAVKQAVGKLAALLVQKGICTIPEVQEACGVSQYKVVGRPVTKR